MAPKSARCASRVPELLPIQTRFQKLVTLLTTPMLTIHDKNVCSTLFISHEPIRKQELRYPVQKNILENALIS